MKRVLSDWLVTSAAVLCLSCQSGEAGSPIERTAEHKGAMSSSAQPSANQDLRLASMFGKPAAGRIAVHGRPNLPVVSPDKLAALDAPWPMFRGRPGARARAAALNVAPQLRWSFAAGAAIRSSPIIGPGESIYFGADDGRLRSLSARGALRWHFPTGAAVRSTAAIARDGTLYFGSDDGSLYAVNKVGKLLWKYASRQRRRVRSSPAIGPYGSIVFGADDGFVRTLSPEGALVWEIQTGGPVRSSPVVAESGLCIVGSDDGKVYAVDLDGTIRWSAQTDGPVRSSGALAKRAVFIGSDDERLYGFRLTDGVPLWRSSIGAPAGGCSPALGADNTVLACAEGGLLTALDAGTGGLRWQRTVGGASWSPAVDRAGSAVVTAAGKVEAIDDAGRNAWAVTLSSTTTGSAAIGLDGTIYAGTDDGHLLAIGRPPATTRDRCLASLGESCACVCAVCPDAAAGCAADTMCSAVLECAIATGCRGSECLAQPSCSRIIQQIGGPSSSSARLAALVGDCAIRECGGCRSAQ